MLCLATTDAAGGSVEDALDAAAAIELIHSFSLVHDDLPALDDDDERRGRPAVHVRFGEAQAILAGDALMAEAFQLANRYPAWELRLEILQATAGMIGGQYLDIDGESVDRSSSTGSRPDACRGVGRLRPLGVRDLAGHRGHRTMAGVRRRLRLLYQLVDDLLDDDGLVQERGREVTRELAEETEVRARARLDEIDVDTAVLGELLSELGARKEAR